MQTLTFLYLSFILQAETEPVHPEGSYLKRRYKDELHLPHEYVF